MNHGKSEKKPKRKCLSDLVSPHLLVCVVLAATCAALVVVILQMDRRVSAFNDTLEEMRREGKKASTVNDSATVSSLHVLAVKYKQLRMQCSLIIVISHIFSVLIILCSSHFESVSFTRLSPSRCWFYCVTFQSSGYNILIGTQCKVKIKLVTNVVNLFDVHMHANESVKWSKTVL